MKARLNPLSRVLKSSRIRRFRYDHGEMEPRIIHVRDAAGLEACGDRLRESAVIGVDSESNSMYVYRERVCYLQIAAGDTIYLVDTLAVDDIDPLLPAFADPAIVKVLHGADYDVVCLGRDYGARFGGLFDTMIAAQLLDRDGLGLAALCRDFFDVELDKSLTKHDWGRRPLEEHYVRYLVEDVLYLEGLREKLLVELCEADIEEEFRLECERVAGMEWSGKPFDPGRLLEDQGRSRPARGRARRHEEPLVCARGDRRAGGPARPSRSLTTRR